MIRTFFDRAATFAGYLIRQKYRGRPAHSPARILDEALGDAMVLSRAGSPVRARLHRGEGAQARAQLLWGAARLLAATPPNPLPGETGPAFAQRVFAGLTRAQIVPILLAASTVRVTPSMVALVGR